MIYLGASMGGGVEAGAEAEVTAGPGVYVCGFLSRAQGNWWRI